MTLSRPPARDRRAVTALLYDGLATFEFGIVMPAAERTLMIVLLSERVDLPLAKTMFASFARALGHLHKKGLIQGDFKPGNTVRMPDGTGISKVIDKHPDRVWDTGICESHALDMMAGLAKTGFKPFFAVYSTFLQRAFDQAFQEAALQGLRRRIAAYDRPETPYLSRPRPQWRREPGDYDHLARAAEWQAEEDGE